MEAQEEIKRQTDVYLQQRREQQEFIVKLQVKEVSMLSHNFLDGKFKKINSL